MLIYDYKSALNARQATHWISRNDRYTGYSRKWLLTSRQFRCDRLHPRGWMTGRNLTAIGGVTQKQNTPESLQGVLLSRIFRVRLAARRGEVRRGLVICGPSTIRETPPEQE